MQIEAYTSITSDVSQTRVMCYAHFQTKVLSHFTSEPHRTRVQLKVFLSILKIFSGVLLNQPSFRKCFALIQETYLGQHANILIFCIKDKKRSFLTQFSFFTIFLKTGLKMKISFLTLLVQLLVVHDEFIINNVGADQFPLIC